MAISSNCAPPPPCLTTDYGSSAPSESDSGSSYSSDSGSTYLDHSSDSGSSTYGDYSSSPSDSYADSPTDAPTGYGKTSAGDSGGFDLDSIRRKGLESYGGAPTGGAPEVGNQNNFAPRLNATVDPQLQGAVDQIAQDPVGAKLIEAANANGLRSLSVENLGDGIMGMYWPDQNRLALSPDTANGNDLVRTLTHELLHAATPQGGDSQTEESLADRIGTEVQQRITGLGAGYTLAGYDNLPFDNGIVDALRNIGIIV